MNRNWRGLPFNELAVILLLLDVVGFVLAFNASYMFAIAEWLGVMTVPLFVVLMAQLVTLYVLDLYTMDERASRFDTLTRTVFAIVVAGMITAGFVYITELRDTQKLFFRGVLPGGFLLFLVWATVCRYLATLWVQRFAPRLRWLVISDVSGESPLCHDLAAVSSFGDMSVLIEDPGKVDSLPENLRSRVRGSYDSIDGALEDNWSGIVIAAERSIPERLLRWIMEKRLAGTRIYDLTDFYERYLLKVPVLQLRDNWFALSHGFDLIHHSVEMNIKRLLDIALALLLLVIASPVMLLAAAAIKLDRRGKARGPVLYRQLRTGAHGREFYIYKFRTMVNDAESQGARWAERNDSRITRVGSVLRASRLDELPQLWNVLKGEMSFIGPRPERPDFNRELEREIPYYDLRHLVKPGITGWAQVMYDYGASAEDALEKLKYDIFYIKNYSLLLDLFIVLKTLRVILARRGR